MAPHACIALYCCFLTALFLYAVSAQSPSEQCGPLLLTTSDPSQPSLQCETQQNCTSLRCQGVLGNNVASIVVTKCRDPVTVDLTIAPPVDADDQQVLLSQQFTRSEVAMISPDSADTISVTMSRNATHLFFQAVATPSGEQVIPETTVFLNASDCMCSSLAELATLAVHTAVEPVCATNEDCSGIRCELDFGVLLYYVELVVLPCQNATELVIEDRSLQPLYMTIFNAGVNTRTFTINGIQLTARAVIDVLDYSMFVQSTLTVAFFEEEIIPRHRIILDRTRCNLTSFPTSIPMTPGTPIPLPANPSDTCLAFFNIVAATQSEPFVCKLMPSCDRGISCRLNLPGRGSYIVNITIEESKEVLFTVTDRDGEVIGSARSMDVEVELTGSDQVTSLRFMQQASDTGGDALAVNVQLLLVRDNQPQSLISLTAVPLPSEGKLSQGQIIAISATVPFIAILLISVVVVIGIWGCVMFVKHREQKKPFEFKPMSYNDLQAGELEPYLGTGVNIDSGGTASAGGVGERGNGVNQEQEEKKEDLAAN